MRSDHDSNHSTDKSDKPGHTSYTLLSGLAGRSPDEVLEAGKEAPPPDLAATPLDSLFWEVAWFANSEDYKHADQLDRVARVLDFLRWLARDPDVERAWKRCPDGVARLLTLAVAHFPVHVGEGGVLDTYDWSYFIQDKDPDDCVPRRPLRKKTKKG